MNNQSEIVCALVLILLIVLVPRYIQLPNSVERLFHDTIGQILLLLIAVFIGAHNLLCGVLLVIFLVSIMLQTTEGFDADNKKKKITDSKKEDKMPEDEMPEDEMPEEEMSQEPSPDPEKESQIKTYQTAINSLQSKINELENIPQPTFPSEMKEYKENKKMENKKMDTKKMDTKKMNASFMTPTPTRSTKESFEDEDEEADIEEGFSCGCDSNSSQVKKIKYEESQTIDESLQGLFEKFENPAHGVKTPNPFDVSGCRFDMKESNPLHETVYGAPVDSCQAYSTANTGTGTVFYPLNAF
jgi:hypothetical protein